jgi:lipoprotein-anchoring transpeptidase ErfK/SrfK
MRYIRAMYYCDSIFNRPHRFAPNPIPKVTKGNKNTAFHVEVCYLRAGRVKSESLARSKFLLARRLLQKTGSHFSARRSSDRSFAPMPPRLNIRAIKGSLAFMLRRPGSSIVVALALLPLAACSSGQAEVSGVVHDPAIRADRILVDKSERVLILYKAGKEVDRYTDIKLGDAPVGHKQFEGDEKTPEGRYNINGRNPASRYHLSLRVSYPNAADRAFAKGKGKSPGGDIFIHGQPNGSLMARIPHDWTDGCIALSNAEIKILWKQVADGTVITIRP